MGLKDVGNTRSNDINKYDKKRPNTLIKRS